MTDAQSGDVVTGAGGRAPDLPPLPWTYTTNAPEGVHDGKGFVYLIDANGRKIGTLWGKPDEKIAVANFICDASESTLGPRAATPPPHNPNARHIK